LTQVKRTSNVIVELPPSEGGAECQLVLRPRRILTQRQFFVLFVLIAVPVSLVAGFSFAVGNAFAPWFAVLDLAIVAMALRWVWRSGDRYERILVDARRLEVRRSPDDTPVFEAHPCWVRFGVRGDAEAPQRVLVGSAGREVEIGSFLPPDERGQLLRRLRGLVAQAPGLRPAAESQ
jgi:uncharacterized membrane protein